MKFVASIILAAFACIAAVSAAPSTGKFATDELAYTSLKNILKQIKDGLRQLQCTNAVFVKVLFGGGLQDELNEFLKTTVAFAGEIVLCTVSGSIGAVLRCEVAVIKSFPQYVATFLESLAEKNGEIAEEIRQQIETKCKKHTAYGLTTDLEESSNLDGLELIAFDDEIDIPSTESDEVLV